VGRPMENATLAPEAVNHDETPPKRHVVIPAAPPRFPDVLAEITRAQPLTMLSVAFIAGLILAWRR
jgi:hypothetical protein